MDWRASKEVMKERPESEMEIESRGRAKGQVQMW